MGRSGVQQRMAASSRDFLFQFRHFRYSVPIASHPKHEEEKEQEDGEDEEYEEEEEEKAAKRFRKRMWFRFRLEDGGRLTTSREMTRRCQIYAKDNFIRPHCAHN